MMKNITEMQNINMANDRKPLHILLADDDQDDCLFYNQALRELDSNTTLTTVNDGEALMEWLENTTADLPDILFLDINMPRKSGTECLAEIKQTEKLKNLPVIMFSTLNDPLKIKFHFKVGANVFIRKPSNFTQLKEVIFHAIPISTETLFSNSETKFILNA